MSFEVIYLIIKCTINNKEKELSIRPDDFLADTLRENGYVSVAAEIQYPSENTT